MICSASDFSSSGLSGDESSGTSSPFTRMVAGRPTLSSRSDALRWTICVMAALKLKVACPACGASGMRVHPEEELAELDGLGVLHEHLPYHARDFGLDFIHDLHRFDDADHLARRHPASGLDVRLGTNWAMMSRFMPPKVTRAPRGPSGRRSTAPGPPPPDERRPRSAPPRRGGGTRPARW